MHWKNVEHFQEQTDMLASCGWELKPEGVTISKRRYSCTLCGCNGKWDDAMPHLETKKHKKKVAWEADAVAKRKADTSEQQKQMWASLFPRATRVSRPPPSWWQKRADPNVPLPSVQLPTHAGAYMPSDMNEPIPFPAELERSKARAERLKYPALAPPLWWGPCRGTKNEMGIWCAECTCWVGWARFVEETCAMSLDGGCCHYNKDNCAKRNLLWEFVTSQWSVIPQL